MNDLHLSAFAPRWRFLYAARFDAYFYAKIKYGTDDEATICLLKNGLSLSSAILLLKKYRSHLKIDIQESTVVFDNTLIDEMQQANENQIIIYEIQSCI